MRSNCVVSDTIGSCIARMKSEERSNCSLGVREIGWRDPERSDLSDVALRADGRWGARIPRSSEWNAHCEAPNCLLPARCSTAKTAESRRQQIRRVAKIDHLLRLCRLVCPSGLTDSRTALGSVILPRRFSILRPRAPHESARGTHVAADSFTTDTHAGATHFSSLTFLNAFQHVM
jgi:hypothetical protein